MRELVRVPIFPLDFLNKDKAVPMELLIDYENSKFYAKSKDGLTFIGLNQESNDHIANGDIHTTLIQKTEWTNNIIELYEAVSLRAVSESPTFTGIPLVPTATEGSNNTQIANTLFVTNAIATGNADSVDGKHVDDTQTSTDFLWTAGRIKAYADNIITANDAMTFKGTLGTEGMFTALPTTDYLVGWTYRIISSGTYAGQLCENGDGVICIRDYNESTSSNADWIITQGNIDGAVTGISEFVAEGDIPIFDGTSGRVIKSSNKALPAGNVVGDTSYGTTLVAGVVKSSLDNNQVSIDESGIMTVNIIDATKGGTGKNSIAINSMLYASANNTYTEIITTELGRSVLAATSNMIVGLNADMVDGYHIKNTETGPLWPFIPVVKDDGSIELGKYVDFHTTTEDGIDYKYRLTTGDNSLTGSGSFSSPEIEASDKLTINNKISIQYNIIDEAIEFMFI